MNPEGHYSIKRQTLWVGYKVHLTETCDGETLHLITHVETTPATTQDNAVTGTIHQALALRGLLPQAYLVDTGYTPMAPGTSWQVCGAEGAIAAGLTAVQTLFHPKLLGWDHPAF